MVYQKGSMYEEYGILKTNSYNLEYSEAKLIFE
jgi:hypothetical protein